MTRCTDYLPTNFKCESLKLSFCCRVLVISLNEDHSTVVSNGFVVYDKSNLNFVKNTKMFFPKNTKKKSSEILTYNSSKKSGEFWKIRSLHSNPSLGQNVTYSVAGFTTTTEYRFSQLEASASGHNRQASSTDFIQASRWTTIQQKRPCVLNFAFLSASLNYPTYRV